MESQHFDNLIRTLFRSSSRRTLLVLLTGGLPVAWPLADQATAKHKRRRKRKKQNGNSVPPPPAEPGCTPNCGGKSCGDDGCGGSCGACNEDFVCQEGTCVCPLEREVCHGACLARCGGFEARNPGNCGCCGISSIPCSLASACCSNVCAGGVFCVGLNTGAACTFDAQCGSNACVDGHCAS